MRLQKHGMSFEMVDWLMKLLFLIAVFMLVVFFIRSHGTKVIETHEIRATVFLERVLSSSGIVYVDPLTGRVYPYILDMAKLPQAQALLEQSIVLSKNDYLAAEFKIASQGMQQTFQYNQVAYEQWKKGIIHGNHVGIEKTMQVLLAQNGKFIPAVLQAHIITPKG